MTNHCDSYFYFQNCVCKDTLNIDLTKYKQFNNTTQKFHCCYDLDISPSSLKTFRNSTTTSGLCESTIANTADYITELNRFRISNNDQGCDFNEYSDISSNPKYKELLNNILVDNAIYNNFFSKNNPPTFSDYGISCPKENEVPYILDYFGINENSIYEKSLSVCSNTKNNLFPTVVVNGKKINYKISRFYTNDNKPVNTYSVSNLGYKSASNSGTRNNKSSIYENEKTEVNVGELVGAVILFVVFLISAYYIKKTYEK